jgi:hypothetical protein
MLCRIWPFVPLRASRPELTVSSEFHIDGEKLTLDVRETDLCTKFCLWLKLGGLWHMYVCMCIYIYMSMCVCVLLFIHLFKYVFICLFIYLLIMYEICLWLQFLAVCGICTYVYIWSRPPSLQPPPPQWAGSPCSSPNSLLFASYWQHFWGPASYLLGLCSISDYQPRIY